MKVFTIGRDEACDLMLDDPMISRRQAVIRLYPSGKIEIIDYSRNGTMVNGVRLAPETLTRITRKDAITFAGTKTLDWKSVPDPSKPIKLAAAGVIGFGLLIFVIWGVKGLIAEFSTPVVEMNVPPIASPSDTTEVKKDEAEKKDEKTKGTADKNPFESAEPQPPANSGKKAEPGKAKPSAPAAGNKTTAKPAEKQQEKTATPEPKKTDKGGGESSNAKKEKKKQVVY